MARSLGHSLPRVLAVGLSLALPAIGLAQEPPAPDAPAEADPVAVVIAALNQDDNGLTINREQGTIDITGTVCLREAEFLEMLACTPDTREHESLIVLNTQPSTIHTALLLMGLEPGSPSRWVQDGEGPDVKMLPPRGPQVSVSILHEVDGEVTEVPANEWVKNQKTEEPMEDAVWVFAGSRVVEYEGRQIYVADSYGTALSLVNFGDDLLARKSEMSDQNESHGQTWGANTQAIPDVGTEVVLRLTLPTAREAAPDAPDAGPAPAEPDNSDSPAPAQE